MRAKHARACVIAGLLAWVATSATAGPAPEIGRVVFATGKAEVIGAGGLRPAAGASLMEGEALRTGGDGYAYVRMVDGGFFILRPDSFGRVARYRVAPATGQSEFRLEMEAGVSRVVTGAGAKAAPERFRFNTPVAAIGVRGTDFTVVTSATETRAWVESGRIVLAPLGGDCVVTGLGPCAGSTSLELSPTSLPAAEVRAGLAVPLPLPVEMQSPDRVTPRGPGEPGVERPQRGKTDLNGQATPVEIALPGSETPAAASPPRTLHWGRWQALAEAPASIDLKTTQAGGAQLVTIGPTHAIVRDASPQLVLPREGSAEFALAAHEGSFRNEKTGQSIPATASNASLSVDFAARSFSTSLTLSGENQPTTHVSAKGSIGADGRFGSAPLSTSHVSGAFGGSSAQEAAYLYQKRVDPDVIVSGATYWGR